MRILGKTNKIIRDKDFKGILSAEFISLTGGLLAGFFLAKITNHLELIPGLLIVIPGLLEMHGNILGSLAGRISTMLQLKKLQPKFYKSKILIDNIVASSILMLVVSFFLGIAAFIVTSFVFNRTNLNIVFVCLGAAIISVLTTIPLTVKSVFYTFNKNLDTDEIIGPYVTTVGDIISIISVLIIIAFI